MTAIDTAAVMRILEQPVDGKTFWEARPETASRVRGRCELIWDAARVNGYCIGENPFRWRGNIAHMLPSKNKLPPCPASSGRAIPRATGRYGAVARQDHQRTRP
jgi:hypothetical protein